MGAYEKKKVGATIDDVNKAFEKKMLGPASVDLRQQHINSKMGDLPAAYSSHMPVTNSQAILDAAEQKIREQYRADLAIHAPKFAAVAPPADEATKLQPKPIDISKLSAYEKIQLGLTGKVGN